MLARPSLEPSRGPRWHRCGGLSLQSSHNRAQIVIGPAAVAAMAMGLLTWILFCHQPLLAADIAVTTMDDTLTGPGCSLRAALLASDLDMSVGGCAAGSPGMDRVLVPEGVFTLLPDGPGEDPEQTGDLDVAGPVEVVGSGRDSTVLEPAESGGGAAHRVFEVLAGGVLSIDGLTIRRGRAELGGGLFVGKGGTLTLSDCRLVDNQASSGGSLYFEAATVTIEGCEITENRSAAGGAIFHSRGDLTVRESWLAFNEARSIDPWAGSPGASGGGGAVAAMGGSTLLEASELVGNRADETRWGGGGILAVAGTLDISRSTLAGNSASDTLADGSVVDPAYEESGGGAIGAWDATVRLVNSTLSGNEADGTRWGGGGLLSMGSDVAVTHVTLWDNSADGARQVAGDPAGGSLALFPGSESTAIEASILAGASPAECFPGASGATGGGEAPNSIGDGTCGGAPSIGSVTGLDTVLADHGGPTRTHRLLAASNAVDAGPAGCVDADGNPLSVGQRGAPRPQNGSCDLGAVERTTTVPFRLTGLADAQLPEPGGVLTASLTFESPGPLPVEASLALGGELTGLGSCGATVILEPGESTLCQIQLTVAGNAGPLSVMIPVKTVTSDVASSEILQIDLDLSDVLPAVQLSTGVKPRFIEEPGGEATLHITVTNSSDAEAVSVVSLLDDVDGSLGGECASITSLGPGESATCEVVVPFRGVAGERPVRNLEVSVEDDEGNSASDLVSAGPRIVEPGSILFQDCFESGDLRAWSSSTS